jgi:hypothetical protein
MESQRHKDFNESRPIKGAKISGDFGASVLITTDKGQTINIAGGPDTGSSYQTIGGSGSENQSLEAFLSGLGYRNLSPAELELAHGVIMAIMSEVDNASSSAGHGNFDEDYAGKFLYELATASPTAAQMFLDWLKSQSQSEKCKRLALILQDIQKRVRPAVG